MHLEAAGENFPCETVVTTSLSEELSSLHFRQFMWEAAYVLNIIAF